MLDNKFSIGLILVAIRIVSLANLAIVSFVEGEVVLYEYTV